VKVRVRVSIRDRVRVGYRVRVRVSIRDRVRARVSYNKENTDGVTRAEPPSYRHR
jgi:hypothetical protein